MIVVGTRGMGRVRRTILGTVSDYLVNHAYCPVIVCKTRSRKQSATGGERSRRASGEGRLRHFSGESIKKLFSIGRQSSRTQSTGSETELDMKDMPESESSKNNRRLSEEKENKKQFLYFWEYLVCIFFQNKKQMKRLRAGNIF